MHPLSFQNNPLIFIGSAILTYYATDFVTDQLFSVHTPEDVSEKILTYLLFGGVLFGFFYLAGIKIFTDIDSPKGKLRRSLTDISGVNDKLARTIMNKYPTLESIQGASMEQLCDILGVGESIATAIKARLG